MAGDAPDDIPANTVATHRPPPLPKELAEEVARWEQVLGEAYNHADDLDRLTNAVALAERLLNVRLTHQGEAWWETVNARQQLANLRQVASLSPERRQQFAESRKLEAQMLEAYNQGAYTNALELAQQMSNVWSEILGIENPDYVSSLNNQAVFLQTLGRWSEAWSVSETVLTLRQRLFKGDHPDLYNSLNNVARCLNALGRSSEALPMYEAALAMCQRMYDKDHAQVALSLNNVAFGLQTLGREAEALPKFEAALTLRQRLFKGDHASVATSLDNLASCLDDLGRYEEALPKHEAALAMRQRLYPGGHSSVASSLNNLACCLCSLGRYEEALPQHEAALALRRRLHPGNHPDVASDRNNVGYCLTRMDRWAEALPHYEVAFAMWQRLLKGDHPLLAAALNNLGQCLAAMRQPADALPKYEAALAMRQRLFSNDHPAVAQSLNNLGKLLAATGQPAEASRRLVEAAEAQWLHLTRNFPTLSPQQKQQFLAGMDLQPGEALESLVFQTSDGEAANGLRAALCSKRFLLEAACQESSALRLAITQAPADWQVKWRGREQLRVQFATLALRGLSGAGPQPEQRQAGDRDRLRSLRDQIEQLEQQLRQDNPTYARAARLEQVTLEDVAAALRSGEALLEYVRYRPYDFVSNQWAAPRYGAFILSGGTAHVEAVDLGEAQPIDDAVRQFRAAMQTAVDRFRSVQPGRGQVQRSEQAVARASSTLRRLVWEPVTKHLPATGRVCVAPDGELSLVPFEALAVGAESGRWRYLGEERELVYVGTGRDLARLALSVGAQAKSSNTAVLVGNPAFSARPREVAAVVAGLPSTAPRFAQAGEASADGTLGAATQSQAKRLQVPRDWKQNSLLDRLTDQARREFERLGWSVTSLTNHLAIEEAVFRVEAPRLLQFATHGYLLDKPDLEAAGWDNPLLRSMLLLAGVNQWQPEQAVFYRFGSELLNAEQARVKGFSQELLETNRIDLADGILTAYEVSGMNLHGTELVNLTACETGLGEVTADGVAGLRQGFLLAGARSLTTSMWEVPATETARQIADFYTRWLGGSGNSKETPDAGRYRAFRAAQLAALAYARETYGAAHPFFWAGFVYVGDPGDLAQTASVTEP